MLSELYIENLAVIEKATIEFGEKLNVFTGETGAGKSILINGINAILGQRMTKDIVRTGSKKAIVTALFINIPDNIKEKLSNLGFELEEDELIISREISIDGRSTARVCGKPATNTILRDITDGLVNIHGQHDNQILLMADRHLEILDNFGEITPKLENYRENFRKLQDVARKIKSLALSEIEKSQRHEMLTYQVRELEELSLRENEDNELEQELKLYRNSADIFNRLNEAKIAISGDDEQFGASELTENALNALEAISSYSPEINEIYERMSSISIELDDLHSEIAGYLYDIDINPDKLTQLEDRLASLKRIQRKYGMTINECIPYLEKCKAELDELESFDDVIEQLEQRKDEILAEVTNQAYELHELRLKAAKKFVDSVTQELKYLDMPNVKLDVQLIEGKLTSSGIDTAEFLISANIGEPPKPISKIASGGELSRIMLALKSVLADKDDIPSLVFDEIDTGISGKAAQKVGKKLAEIAENRQVLCVTHLAQIAIMADKHMLIEKNVVGNRTYTEVSPLDFDSRQYEIARIMAGDNHTDLMLKNARELLISVRKDKKEEGI